MNENLMKMLSVLYVEDEEDTREQMEIFLRRKVGSVRLASNGEEGLDMFLKSKPSVVITDNRMPVMGGIEMSRQIKNISPETPVIIVTAYTEDEFEKSLDETNIDYYFPKPLDMRLLLGALEGIAQKEMVKSGE